MKWHPDRRRQKEEIPPYDPIKRPSVRPIQLDPKMVQIVVIGSSTGAPNVVEYLLTGLPADFPCPIAIAQHMPPNFTESFSRRLDNLSPLSVFHAEQGMPLLPGTVTVARGHEHMKIKRGLRYPSVIITKDPESYPYKPSVNELFASAADQFHERAAGVILTGMGQDGKLGAIEMHRFGAKIIGQNEKTCVVYGMPKAVAEAQVISAALDPEGIRQSLLSLCPPESRRPHPNPGVLRH